MIETQNFWENFTKPVYIVVYIVAIVLIMLLIVISVMLNEYRFNKVTKRLKDAAEEEKRTRRRVISSLTIRAFPASIC